MTVPGPVRKKGEEKVPIRGIRNYGVHPPGVSVCQCMHICMGLLSELRLYVPHGTQTQIAKSEQGSLARVWIYSMYAYNMLA